MVEINGFPQKKDENLKDLAIKLATDMKVPISNGDVEVVHRLSTRERAGIIVQILVETNRGTVSCEKSVRDYDYSLSPGAWQSFISIEVCRDCIPALASSCKKQLTRFFVCLLFFLKVKRIS